MPNLLISPALLIVSVVLIVVMIINDNQSSAAVLMKVTFQGEYKTENEDWKPLEDHAKIIYLDGEVRLKGFFQLQTADGIVLGRVPKGLTIIAYFNHIGG